MTFQARKIRNRIYVENVLIEYIITRLVHHNKTCKLLQAYQVPNKQNIARNNRLAGYTSYYNLQYKICIKQHLLDLRYMHVALY